MRDRTSATLKRPGTSTPGPDRPGHTTLTDLEARPEARSALEAWLRDHGTIEEAVASRPDAMTLAGRGRVLVVPAPGPDAGTEGGERWAVRHYRRGGAIASVLGDRYFRIGTPRPIQEFRVGRALEDRGIPTPVHIGAAAYPAGIWYRGDLVTRYVPDSRDLAAILFPGRSLGSESPDLGIGTEAGAVDPQEAMRAAGRLIRRLHEGGVDHPDLNLKNILIHAAGDGVRALALDLDGARIGGAVGERARARMIARFWRSARKWERVTGAALPPGAEDAFDAGYGE